MTKVLEIRHLADAGQVQLGLDDGGQVRLAPPETFLLQNVTPDERALQWYFREYMDHPFGANRERAEGIESVLRNLGRLLFELVFGSNEDTRAIYAGAAAEGLAGYELSIVSSDAGFLSLPWELINEPEAGYLASDLKSLTRRSGEDAGPAFDGQLSEEQLNVLLVSPMPLGDSQSHGSLAREAVSALESLDVQVELDYLSPPTLDGLADRLEQRPGYYHLVHLDGVKPGSSPDELVLEDGDYGTAPVPTSRLAALLGVARVPVALLTFGAGDDNGEASAPPHLLQKSLADAGVPAVVGLAHPLQGSAAGESFLRHFYQSMIAGNDAGSCVAQARRALMAEPQRATLGGKLVSWDWTTVTAYKSRDYVSTVIEGEKPDPLAPPVIQPQDQDAEVAAQMPAAGQYGLVGRQSEMVDITRLQRQQPVVLLSGNTGVGKTELALGLARWLQRTGRDELPGGVFYTTFEASHPAGLERVVHEIGTAVAGLEFADMSAERQRQWVTEYLQQQPCLLIWDNLENVAGFPTGVPGLLEEEGQAQLDAFLSEVTTGGQSRALLVDRRPFEAWLKAPHADYRLSGLSGHYRLELAADIIQKAGVEGARLGPDCVDLLDLLEGHPLAMQLALPMLRETQASVIAGETRKIVEEGTAPIEEGRDDFLAAVMDYSFSHMSHRSRIHLPFLALFQRRVMMDIMNHITQERAYRNVMSEELGWGACRTLLRSALASGFLEPVSPSVYQIHPALPQFLGSKLQRQVPSQGIRQLELEFVRVYADTADYFMESLYENQDSGVTAILAEEGNLTQALGLALEAQQWDNTQLLIQPLAQVFRMQKRFPELRRLRAQLMEVIGETASDAEEKGAADLWLYLLGTDANESADLGELERAESLNLQLQHYLEAQEGSDSDPRAAAVYYQFGQIALKRWQLDEADEWFTKSLAIIEQTPVAQIEDEGMLATAADNYYGLGQVKQYQRYYADSKEWYKKALDIHQRIPDEEEMVKDYRSLGLVCQLRFEYDEAENWYQRARNMVEEARDEETAILVFHELGTLSHAQYLFEDAQRWYDQALSLADRLGKLEQVAIECHHLGLLSQVRGIVYEEAEEWFLAALEIRERLGDRRTMGDECRQLGVLFHEQEKWAEAKDWYNQAREIFEEMGDIQRASRTYGQLGMVAERQGDLPEALGWVARTYQVALDYNLPMMVQIKAHLGRLRDSYGDDNFAQWWRGYTGEEPPADLDVDTSEVF